MRAQLRNLRSDLSQKLDWKIDRGQNWLHSWQCRARLKQHIGLQAQKQSRDITSETHKW